MEGTQLEPRISALLVAQDAFKDVQGRTHVHGIFDNIASPKFPILTKLMVFVSFKGTKQGTYQGMIRLVDSLNNKIIETEQMPFEVSEFKGHNFFINMNTQFPSPQLYRIKLFVDGIERMEVPLMIRHSDVVPPKSG